MINEYLIDPEFLVNLAKRRGKHSFFLKSEWGLGTHRFCLRTLDNWETVPKKEGLSLKQKLVYEYYVKEIVLGAQINRNLEFFDWNEKHSWGLNAERLSESEGYYPIRMIFTDSCNSLHQSFSLNDLCLDDAREDEFLRYWKSDIDAVEENRSAQQIAKIMGLFMSASKSIIWVDPYFQVQPRYTNVVEALFKQIELYSKQYQRKRKLKIITKNRLGRTSRNTEDFWQGIQELFSRIELSGTSVTVILADDGKNSKYKFHDRYMLSELGGVLFPGGTDECPGRDIWEPMLLSRKRATRKRDYYTSVVADKGVSENFLIEVGRMEFDD
ncbi:MAG: hypothetical protein ACTSWQ_06485 [Candidatus Thorarchaeota archaeon]